MEYSEETSAGGDPDENAKLIEMGEIGLASQVSAPFNHCADDSEETHVEKCTENQNSSKCLADDNANDLVDASTDNLNTTYAPAYCAKQGITEFTDANYELQQAYRILRDLMSEGHKGVNSPFMDSVETVEEDVDDYYEVISKPMWLKKVRHKFLKREYSNITQAIADIRLILENCYRYYGPDSTFTKKALRLEQILEQKLALLPRELRDKTTLEITSGRPVNDDIIATRRRSTRHSVDYTSILLNLVRHEKAERNRELKKKLTEGKKAEKEEKEKEVLVWEDKLLEEPLKTQMKAMWELPMIGHFFYLCQTVLNMPEVSQFELERILVMPRASSLLPKIMTSLLSNPTQRAKLDRNPPMPYKVWQSRLQNRIQSWYKILHARENRGDLVFQQLGIEANLFKILGPENPLNEKRFHELSFHQKIWCVKGLCDYILYNHRTVQDALNDQLMDDMREYVLGRDSVGNMYLHFPQFCGQDLRIYRQRMCSKPPSPGCWGAPYTKKRKLPKTEKIPAPPMKKQKMKAPKPPVKKVQPCEPSLALLCTRRSPRFSKSHDVTEQVPYDDAEDTDVSEDLTSEEEQKEEESDSEEEDDDDLEPNIAKFELVVDSVETLRTFMDKFKNDYENMRNRKEKQPYSRCEAELYRRLKNLLAELEPWESKLQKSAQRIRNRLRREWEDLVEDEEEIEDIWGSDGESEGSKSRSGLSTSDNSNDNTSNSCDKAAFKLEKPTTRARSAQKLQPVKQEEISTEELLNQDDYSCEYRTRARLQQLRIMRSMPKKNIKPEREIRVNGSTPGQQDLLLAHSRHNTTSQAKELYAWETLRQILVPAANMKSEDLQASSDAHCQGNVNNFHKQGLSNKMNETHASTATTSPEKQNLIHAKLDMLGAMQAAMAKKPNLTSLMLKQPQPNTSKIVQKTGQSTKNNHFLPRRQPKASSRSGLTPCGPNMLSPTTVTSARQVLKYKVVSSNAVPTKQQLNDLSSVAENTKNLKRLLEQVNKVAPSSVISSTVCSPASGEPSVQPKAQVMLFPMFDADGKSVVYRVTSSKTLSSIPGMDIKKIALALATSTTSALPPGFLVEKISVEGDLLHGQGSSISQDVLVDIAFRQAKATAKSPQTVRPAVAVPKPQQVKPVVKTAKELAASLSYNATTLKGHVNKVVSGKSASSLTTVPRLQAPLSQLPTSSVGSAGVNCVASSTPNTLVLTSPPQQMVQASLQQPVQQQMLLVPVQNQHGQTMYLQIPTQAPGAVNAGKPTVPQVRKLPISQQSQVVPSVPARVTSQAILPIAARKPSGSLAAAQAGVLANPPSVAGTPLTPHKVAPSVVQRLIPALSSKRHISTLSNMALVSEPPPLAPISKQKTPISKRVGPQQGGALVMPGSSSINLNALSAASAVTSTLKNAAVLPSEQALRTTFSGVLSLGSLTNNTKSVTVVNTALSNTATNGPTPPKNPLTPVKVNEQVARLQVQPSAAHAVHTTAPGTLIHSAATPTVNTGIMPAPVVQSASPICKLNPPRLEYSSDVLSASVASLMAKNPALAAAVQKYMQSGHKVVIAQQGNQLVLQAYPPQVNVSVPQVTAPQVVGSRVTVPPKQVQVASSQSNAALLHHEQPKHAAAVPPAQNWSLSSPAAVRLQNNAVSKVSPNVAQTMGRSPAVMQTPAPSSLSIQVGSAGGVLSPPSGSNMLQNVVCQTVVSSPSKSGVLVNSTVNASSPCQITKTVHTTSPINATQQKLVMIRDTTSDKQTLGILLDNGQVVPLNASISFTNAVIS